MNEILYVIDSSVIIRRTKHDMYEYDSFPIHWDNFDRMINEGKIISPIIVKDEIVNKKQMN
ncbi:DUF4411 family protein [Methanobrevibacter curvatus]|uniref:PIN domain-containing protein n=1 Tax=Methanobrevibacter curvatus TaxID=49547 RepID=A0A165Z2F6_9EURY|nr:DUF4411 family protein [Methanobrevibacter curvatus]KZX10166.1 hypothetical protein MBCUR_19010 [Methanobrevibacter curvatus]